MKRLIGLMMVMVLCGLSVSEAETLTSIPWDVTVCPAPVAEAYLPDNAGYHDDSLDIRIETFRRDDTTVMAAYVTLKDPSQLRTTLAGPNAGSKRTAPVSAMARKCQAVMAINGDYFCYHNEGIVVRNTQVMRLDVNPGRDTLIIDDKGDFTILSPTSDEGWAGFKGNVVHAFCFGPGLVVDGKALTDLDSVKVDNGKGKKTQRMAIGQMGTLSYLILACEGPENEGSIGFDLLQMAALCQEMGCKNAYNLDGGSSSSIVLHNEKINALSTGKIRSVGDAIIFATLGE